MRYRKVDPRFWSDEKVIRMGAHEKLLALYALTAQSNRIGLFVLSPSRAREETGLLDDTLYDTLWMQVVDAMGWRWDHKVRVLWIPRWWKYNPPTNVDHLRGALTDLHELPETELLYEFASNTSDLQPHHAEVLVRACSTACGTGCNTGCSTQEQEQEQEQELDMGEGEGVGGSASTTKKARRKEKPKHVPDDLKKLVLYQEDAKLCAAWPSLLPVWTAAYLGVDVMAEVVRAHAWEVSNPDRRKVNRPRFLDNWLKRAQDRGLGTRPAYGNHPQRAAPVQRWMAAAARVAAKRVGPEGEIPKLTSGKEGSSA